MLAKAIHNHIKVCSAEEALKHPAANLHVPEKAEVHFSPSTSEMFKYFAHVRLTEFKDLQVLGFVPRDMSEQTVRDAIEADNTECRRIAANATHMQSTSCQCNGSAKLVSHFQNNCRSSYQVMRDAYHPALARVLSDHHKTLFNWDDPLPTVVNRWVAKLDDYTVYHPGTTVLVAALMDITVERNAILTLDPTLSSLNARNIFIHRQGKVVYQGSFVRIWAGLLTSFIDINVTTSTTTTGAPPWLVFH